MWHSAIVSLYIQRGVVMGKNRAPPAPKEFGNRNFTPRTLSKRQRMIAQAYRNLRREIGNAVLRANRCITKIH